MYNNSGKKISSNAIIKRFEDQEKELTNLGTDMFSMMRIIQEIQQKYDIVLIKLLNQMDLPTLNEIDFTDEEFEELYAPLVPSYFIEKSTGDFVKVVSIFTGWSFDREASMEAKKFIFKSEQQTCEFEVGSLQEAYMKLKEVIRENNRIIIEE
jgi:hypothetical protein